MSLWRRIKRRVVLELIVWVFGPEVVLCMLLGIPLKEIFE